MTTAPITTQAGIYQAALAAAGTRNVFVTPEDGSLEADQCDLFYEDVLRQVLRAAPWQEAKSHERLALAVERSLVTEWQAGDPDPGYLFAYEPPADMVNPRFLTTFERFTIGNVDNAQKMIMANTEDAILVYTRLVDDPTEWSSDLRLAVSSALAAYVAWPLHCDLNRAIYNQNYANSLIKNAAAIEANQEDETYEWLPPWLAARGGSISGTVTRYIYPNGPSISVESLASVS